MLDSRTMSELPPLVCNVCCETNGLKRCGFCKVKFYCSREHQMKDWPDHKTFCQNKRKEQENLNKENNSQANNTRCAENVRSTETSSVSSDLSVSKGKKENENNDRAETNEDTGTKKGKNGIPFDTRPYLPVKPVPMKPSSDNKTVAKIAVENLNSQGYCVIDGAFSKHIIDKTLKDFNKLEERGRFQSGKLAGGRTSGEDDKKVVNAAIRSDKIVWAEGDEAETPGVRDVMTKLDHILVEFNELLHGKYFISNRTKAMMACYPGSGAYYKRHVDNPNKDGRLVTCILYLNKDWDAEKHGGTLRILPSDGDTYVDVAPIANRLLFFWSDRRNPHEVHPAYRTRYAVTVWYMDRTERERAKLDHIQEEMARIRGSQQLFTLRQTIEKRERLSKEIEDTTNKAIDSLTEEELAAIGAMVEGAPNPKEVLTSLGIYSAIQDKLLERLKQLKTT